MKMVLRIVATALLLLLLGMASRLDRDSLAKVPPPSPVEVVSH